MLWMLVCAALSMGLSAASPNPSDIDRAIALTEKYMKHYLKNTRRMEPVINADPMEDLHNRRTSKRKRPGTSDNTVRIFPKSGNILDNPDSIEVITNPDCPIDKDALAANSKDYRDPLLNFGLFPINSNTCRHHAFADQEDMFILIRAVN